MLEMGGILRNHKVSALYILGEFDFADFSFW